MSDRTIVPAPAGVNKDTRIIFGAQAKCIDGRWTDRDGVELPAGLKLIVLGTMSVLQHWQNEDVIDIKDPAKFNVGALNAQIPREQWEDGINGPKEPWCHTFVTYLIDPESAERFTHANSTVGAKIATEDLTEKIVWMRALKGARVSPVVELSNKLMKTKHGQKLRPHFRVLGWKDLSGVSLTAQEPTPMLEGPGIQEVDPVTSEEIMNDELPF